MNNPIPTEHEELVALFQWAEVRSQLLPELALMFKIRNESQSHIRHRVKMKAEGLKRGVPDALLPVARGIYHGLFIEMKRVKGPGLTVDQKNWAHWLRWQGYRVEMTRGCTAAVRVIWEYLRVTPTC